MAVAGTGRTRLGRRAAVAAVAVAALAGGLLATGPAAAGAPAPAAAPAGDAAGGAGGAGGAATSPTIKVMTRNLYLGSTLAPAMTAVGGAQFLAAVATIYAGARATDFPTRATALAREIRFQRPDVVGLQEVTRWRFSRTNAGPALPGYDFLALLLAALRAQGLDYRVAVAVNNADISAPLVAPSAKCVGYLPADCTVELLDRDAILVNAASGITVGAVRRGTYTAQESLATPLGARSFQRGWVTAQMTYQGRSFKMLNTHLEVEDFPKTQVAQGAEILAGPARAAGTLILTGDLNSDAYGTTTRTYRDLLAGGLRDSWVPRRDGRGLSCCQNSGLTNVRSQLRTRIDLVLLRGRATAVRAVLVGHVPFQARQPRWASDHAGVVATVRLT